jgi:predicted alpha/beta superfamily hydrolase
MMSADQHRILGDVQAATLDDAIQFDASSRESGRTYRIRLYKPNVPAGPEGYPVAWFTDGNATFGVAAMQMALRAGMELEPAIIVAVGYPETAYMVHHTRRTLDLTPSTPDDKSPFPGLETGGAEAFERFIVNELRPKLALAYPIDLARQSLYGHSLGGLFVLGTLFRHPTAFSHYIASSPSIWWNDASVLGGVEPFLAQQSGHPKLFMCAGGQEETAARFFPGATPQVIAAHEAFVEKAGMIRRARSLASLLAGRNVPVEFTVFADEGHTSVAPASITRALDFFLSYERHGAAALKAEIGDLGPARSTRGDGNRT